MSPNVRCGYAGRAVPRRACGTFGAGPPRRPTRERMLAEPRVKTAIRTNCRRSARTDYREETEPSRNAIPSAEIVSTRPAHVKGAYGVAAR